MNLTKLFLGSIVFLAFGAQVACSGATPSAGEEPGTDESDIARGGKKISFKTFADGAAEGAFLVDGAEDCSFASTGDARARTLTLTSGKDTIAVVAPSTAAITLTDKESDGFTKTYKIAGIGTLEVVNASDAFVMVTLTSTATHKSATCEIDF